MTWPTRASRTAYENRWIVVREDEVVRPDGSEGIYGVVEVRQPAVFVVALTEAEEVVLIDVARHTVGRSIEVPAGGSDGEDPLVAARRELREETGFEADDWRELGRSFALNGICHAPEVVFLARGLRRVGPGAEGPGAASADQVEEGIAEVRLIPWPRVLDMVRDGTITDGETHAALLLAALALGRVS